MSTSKFAAWVRVKPAPSTVAASSAVLKQLKKQGRIVTFIRKPCTSSKQDEASYYTVFSHEPPSLNTEFTVPVYHDLAKPRDVDPFNIRGILNRKPNPEPIELQCKLEMVSRSDMQQQTAWINEQSPYREAYFIDFKQQPEDLQILYREIGAPPGVARSLGDWDRAPGQKPAPPPPERAKTDKPEHAKTPKLKMHALMESWREAHNSVTDEEEEPQKKRNDLGSS